MHIVWFYPLFVSFTKLKFLALFDLFSGTFCPKLDILSWLQWHVVKHLSFQAQIRIAKKPARNAIWDKNWENPTVWNGLKLFLVTVPQRQNSLEFPDTLRIMFYCRRESECLEKQCRIFKLRPQMANSCSISTACPPWPTLSVTSNVLQLDYWMS